MSRSSPQKRRADQRRMARRYEPYPRMSLDLSPVLATSTIPGVALLPIRLFLGITFLYGGWQKLTDPGFFTVGSTTYIGSQLRGFAHGSPINFLLSQFFEHAVAIGVLTLITEMVIGLLVLLGLFTRLAALGGLMLNLVFFLSASWHIYPYFLGSDIVFVMAWLTVALAGPGAYYLDAVVAPRLRERVPYGLGPLVFGRVETVPMTSAASTETVPVQLHPRRASLLSRGEALAAIGATCVLVLLGLSPKGSLSHALKASAPQPAATPPPAGSSSAAPPAGAAKVGNTSQIPVNSAIAFTDPKSGDPAVVINTGGAGFLAYDAVCTHGGCTVQYDPQYKLLVCPCHGGAFDPAHGGQVVAGPPPAPLTALPIQIDSAGNILLA